MAVIALRPEPDDDAVDAALRALGLTQKVLADALLFGEAERRTCTENDPGILKGMIGWGRPIRSLREQLRPNGWQRKEPKSLPLVVSPDNKIAITIAAGDDQTGNPRAAFACTKYEKGPMLRDWVNGYHQLTLDADPDAEPEEVPDLWVLLVQRSHGEILAELSRPTSITRDKRLRFGEQRILLAPIPIDQTLPYEDEGDDEPDTEVPVERL